MIDIFFLKPKFSVDILVFNLSLQHFFASLQFLCLNQLFSRYSLLQCLNLLSIYFSSVSHYDIFCLASIFTSRCSTDLLSFNLTTTFFASLQFLCTSVPQIHFLFNLTLDIFRLASILRLRVKFFRFFFCASILPVALILGELVDIPYFVVLLLLNSVLLRSFFVLDFPKTVALNLK